MTQIHPDSRPDMTGEGGTPPQQPAAQPVRDEPTAPVWFGQTQGLPRENSPLGPGAAAAHPAYPSTPQPPAGPPPSFPTRDGAEPAQPAKRRSLTELTAVAAIAALLASGGTYAVGQLTNDSQASPSAKVSTQSPTTEAGPVQQASATNPNWTATSAAVAPSVVAISVQSGQGSGQGSGVIIDEEGHIVTNHHVVGGGGEGTRIKVTLNDGRTYSATIAGTDPSTDLAVITIDNPPKDLVAIALGDSEALKVGDPVMAVGNPLGLAGTVTTGIVSALDRPVTTGSEGQGQSDPVVTNAIQTSAAINPGNSGGALVNASGQLVGINSSIATLGSGGPGGQGGSIGIGFAIPVNEAKWVATQLIEKGEAEHSFLGVTPKDGTAADGASERAGAEIVSVSPGTPAAEAGLKEGDVVVAVDGDRVDSALSLVASIRERPVGSEVAITVLRGGKEVELDATLADKAAAGG